MMQISVPKVTDSKETRVPLTPDFVNKLVKLGADIQIESGLGQSIYISDDAYTKVGATVAKNRAALWKEGDIVVGLTKPEPKEIKQMKANAIYLGMLDPFNAKPEIDALAASKVSGMSMEMIPRSTRAQKMDVLSSQASLAGYYAVMLAAERLYKILPMMMTPAGTIKPSRVFIIGAGVAGLQAIATAKRLGARVEAFDTRPVVKEEVQSLGAKFIEIDLGDTGQTKDGYAKALTEEQLKIQKEGMAKICAYSDIVITTAQIFGKKAPLIITKDMVAGMQPGSVIVDMAVETGGNVDGSKLDQEVDVNGVRILGLANLPGHVAAHASQMYASNIFNFISDFWNKEEKTFELKMDDEIIERCLITHNGEMVNAMLKELGK